LLDRAKPFPTREAIKIIERNLGRPITTIFEIFDPVPIGSASLACVFQAVLKSGERVAVKVRRPGVGHTLTADLRALDWYLLFGEALTLIRPGSTRRLRHDLERILTAELNFRNEARYTDIFRRRSEAVGGEMSAPRIHFAYCTEEVMVSEFVSGVWMWEIMAAVDAKDGSFLSQLSEQGIEPKILARKLIRSAHRQLLESLFYHADPHPANIVVRPDNKLCIIDFGAIGRMSPRMRTAWRELHYHMANGDVERMVRCTLNLTGSLPPVDIERIISSLEIIYSDWIYAMNSADAEWWERSTAQTMLRFFAVAREHGLPATMETIQFLRATLLYDTIVARLDRDINVAKEWQEYIKRAGKEARARIKERIRKRLNGPTKADYLQFEQLADTLTQFLFNWQRQVEQPIVHYKSIVGKIAYTVTLLLRLAGVLLIFVGIGGMVHVAADRLFHYSIPWTRIVEVVSSIAWLQVGALFGGLLLIRRLIIRMSQPDTKPDVER
jgi:ubiquinone biosynthesis protein